MRQDEDIERRKRFPWKGSLRRPGAGASSVVLVAIVAGVYLAALVSIAPLMVGAPVTFRIPLIP
jgi:hypothetical protein